MNAPFGLIKYTLFLLLFLAIGKVNATHNRSGEITYTRVSGNTYKITITTYTRFDPNDPGLPSNAADRTHLVVNYGDGSSDTIPRVDSPMVATQVRKNVYVGYHTYTGPGTYTISMEDPNRNADIQNINNGHETDLIVFSLYTQLIISPFFTGNSSPVLSYPPIDNACINRVFYHNPTAIDPDGDSLSYHLATPVGAGLSPVPGYVLPSGTTINQFGDLRWDSPQQMGVYNFAILIKEWRLVGGEMRVIGYVLRDLQVTVINCSNDNPILNDLKDTCILAGTVLNQTISATDPNLGQTVDLLVNGSPFQVQDPATFVQTSNSWSNASGDFSWNTNCGHVRKTPYQVYIKAKDNDSQVPLLDVGAWNIKVVGPAPQNPQAVAQANSINLSWDPSVCPQVKRYDIYRRNGSYGFVPNHCELGVPAYTGFTYLASVNGVNNTTFSDNNNGYGLTHGHDYCYMIVAIFPDNAESYASEEVCAKLTLDVPVITNVSVLSTGNPGGDSIAWAKPRQPDFNEIAYPGPYRYLIYRAPGLNGTNFSLIDSTALNTTLDDTSYVDNTVNSNSANTYKIALFDYSGGNRRNAGETNPASSVFLSITATDNKLNLSWQHSVPWTNTRYTIFRKITGITTQFDSLTTVTGMNFSDTGLVNGREYCYYIMSEGFYSVPGLVNPIINLSQEKCAEPIDNIPPCAPSLNVVADCETPRNTLVWNNPNLSCADDVIAYEIFYKPTIDGNFTSILQIDAATTTTAEHVNAGSIAGCYYMVAIDSAGNRSLSTDTACIDNCPDYELPNVFSPDGDGINDFFHPYPYKFVESVDITIYNRWGQPVFHSADPDINWAGQNQETGKPVSEGVYYYVCTVYEKRLEGTVPRILKGFVHLFRGQEGTPKAE